ncbi:hypothetical protein HG530_000772 [Fusarium avenaceum]|nr:hypothetical protein HG530_000772 [Fusarium avenaceum]
MSFSGVPMRIFNTGFTYNQSASTNIINRFLQLLLTLTANLQMPSQLIPHMLNHRLLSADPQTILLILRPMVLMSSRLIHRSGTHGFLRVRIVSNVKLAPQVLGTDKGQQDNVDVYARHEDADDLAVVIAALSLFSLRKGKVFAEASFDSG